MTKKKDDILSQKINIQDNVEKIAAKIERELKKYFRKQLREKNNIHGITNRNTRDIFLKTLEVFFEFYRVEIREIITKKLGFKLDSLNVVFYKLSGDFTDLYLILNFGISINENLKIGIIIRKIVKDIFVSIMDKNTLEKIIEGKKEWKDAKADKIIKLI